MAAQTDTDEDLIIFNDDEDDTTGSETVEVSPEPKKAEKKANPVLESNDDFISFGDEDVPAKKETKTETQATPELDLSVVQEESITPTDDETQEHLLKLQETGAEENEEEKTTSFDDLGIDLGKLGDKEGENLEHVEKENVDADFSLDAFSVESEAPLVEQAHEDTHDEFDMSGLQDLGNNDSVDETTLNGILDGTIAKILKREKAIDGDIETVQQKIHEKEDKVAELKGEIEHINGEIRDEQEKIDELENEKSRIVQTREGIESMKH